MDHILDVALDGMTKLSGCAGTFKRMHAALELAEAVNEARERLDREGRFEDLDLLLVQVPDIFPFVLSRGDVGAWACQLTPNPMLVRRNYVGMYHLMAACSYGSYELCRPCRHVGVCIENSLAMSPGDWCLAHAADEALLILAKDGDRYVRGLEQLRVRHMKRFTQRIIQGQRLALRDYAIRASRR